MGGWRVTRRAVICAGVLLAAACTVQLVAPYNSELQQQASALQAQVGTWDLTMRAAEATINADPRNPEVVATLNAWRGDADAMRTLALASDTGLVPCATAMKDAANAINAAIPASLRPAVPAQGTATTPAGGSPNGCEAEIVASLSAKIDKLAGVLKYCQVPWVPDSYFAALAQTKGAAPNPPAAPSPAQQASLKAACGLLFDPVPQTPANAANAGHGIAASDLLTTLQVIVFIETRKKAAATTTSP